MMLLELDQQMEELRVCQRVGAVHGLHHLCQPQCSHSAVAVQSQWTKQMESNS